jgi:UDP-GlcNAc3NAcA epimerase
MKIVTIIGARPQFIKAAVVSRAISESNKLVTSNSSLVTEVIIHTGQHYDRNMSDVFFEEMNIPRPDYFLDINGLSHGAMTGQMLEKLEEVLVEEKPDIVLVYGDTNSTLAGSLAAVKLHIPVAHVEAGLRSFNRKMPEEINRLLTDHASNILFCPTQQAVQNLKDEGIGLESASAHEFLSSSAQWEESNLSPNTKNSTTYELKSSVSCEPAITPDPSSPNQTISLL